MQEWRSLGHPSAMRRFGRSSSKSGPHREKSRVIAFSRSVKKADQRRQKRGRASGGALVDASREYQAVTASRDQSSCPSWNYPPWPAVRTNAARAIEADRLDLLSF